MSESDMLYLCSKFCLPSAVVWYINEQLWNLWQYYRPLPCESITLGAIWYAISVRISLVSKITKMCSKAASTMLNIIIVCSTIVWGILISLQLPFFPTEAEKKGAKASQVWNAFNLFCGTYPMKIVKLFYGYKKCIFLNIFQSMGLCLEFQTSQPSLIQFWLDGMV